MASAKPRKGVKMFYNAMMREYTTDENLVSKSIELLDECEIKEFYSDMIEDYKKYCVSNAWDLDFEFDDWGDEINAWVLALNLDNNEYYEWQLEAKRGLKGLAMNVYVLSRQTVEDCGEDYLFELFGVYSSLENAIKRVKEEFPGMENKIDFTAVKPDYWHWEYYNDTYVIEELTMDK